MSYTAGSFALTVDITCVTAHILLSSGIEAIVIVIFLSLQIISTPTCFVQSEKLKCHTVHKMIPIKIWLYTMKQSQDLISQFKISCTQTTGADILYKSCVQLILNCDLKSHVTILLYTTKFLL